MTKEYAIEQYKNFGSVFSEKAYLVDVLEWLREEFPTEKFTLEWGGWGWIIHRQSDKMQI